MLPIPRTVSVIASPGRVPAVSERRFAASLPPAPMPTAMTPARVILPPVVAPIDPAAPLSEARIQLALLALTGFSAAEPLSRPAAPPPALPRPAGDDRLTASFWALARPGSATGGPVQLAGGQAGLRVRMPIADSGQAAVAARIATPLAGQGREAALGVEWRPIRAPFAVVVERRMALDRGRDGTGMGLIAGIDRALPGSLGIEAYGQAGAVARHGIEPYADGAARVLHKVAGIGNSVLKLGIGGWGGAQRGAMRMDIGPSLVAAIPVGRGAVRLSVDWRQRVAGDAAPGSGPALTLGSDF
ncbi:hypothetical protein [Sphingomonas hankookensis]|uniref:hypothetical protein n=1 Tax=Sphingomonas hankookensis TaxID=563996 RepID=UPI003F794C5C